MTANSVRQAAPSQQPPPQAAAPPVQPGDWGCPPVGTQSASNGYSPNAVPTAGPPDFYFNQEERAAGQARDAKLIEDLRKIEEAKAIQASIKAGGEVPFHDVMFEFRQPRDVLRQAAPPPFSVADVPPAIGEFAEKYALSTGYDISGVIVAAVTTAASVIDDGYRLTVRPESNWTVSARQWSFLCGGPSAGKSPCIRAATDPVKRMHGVLYDRWHMANDDRRREERDPLPALYTSDTTIAALSQKLRDNPRGLLMLTEEFASWIGGVDAADRGESAKNRGDWLQLRDGGPHQIDRIERGSVYVPNWGVSVLAACTPDGLAKQMKFMPEDGLIQRFIPCVMAAPNLDAIGDSRQAATTWGQWLEWAYTATQTPTALQIRLSPAAQMLFDSEVRSIRELVVATETFAPAYAAHLGKHPGMLGEVALAFHVFEQTTTGNLGSQVSQNAMELAIRYLRKARRHAYTLYSSILTTAPAFDLARALARSIVAADQAISAVNRDWMTAHCQGFRKADDRLRREAVQILEDADWLSAQTQVRSYGGWPRQYAVHHMVFQMFAREGEQWRARRAAVKDAIGEAAE